MREHPITLLPWIGGYIALPLLLGVVPNEQFVQRVRHSRKIHESSMVDRSTSVRVLLLDPECESAHRRAKEIGETYGSFSTGIRLSLERLAELAGQGAQVEVHVYDMLPTWRVIGLDAVLFVSAFGERHEGHTSPMYKITGSPHGALHRVFRRFLEELRRTSRQVI